MPLYPDNYKILFENDRVRVVDFKLRKGATEEAHSHPAHVAPFLADLKIRFTLPDGTLRTGGIFGARLGCVAKGVKTGNLNWGGDGSGAPPSLRAPFRLGRDGN